MYNVNHSRMPTMRRADIPLCAEAPVVANLAVGYAESHKLPWRVWKGLQTMLGPASGFRACRTARACRMC